MLGSDLIQGHTTRRRPPRVWVGFGLLALSHVVLSSQDLRGQEHQPPSPAFLPSTMPAPAATHRLQRSLREISGLAFAEDGRLFGHNDEQGQVMELSLEDGRILRRIWLEGRPRGDFEGLAIRGDTFHLVTSSGTLVSFADPGPGRDAPFIQDRTDVGKACEVEGLTAQGGADTRSERLLLICKTMERRADRGSLVVFAYDLTSRRASDVPILRIPMETLDPFGLPEGVNPSGISTTPNGTLLVIAARQRVLLEIDLRGSVLQVLQLDRRNHRQAEGIAERHGDLFLGDEGGDSRGRLTRYPMGAPSS